MRYSGTDSPILSVSPLEISVSRLLSKRAKSFWVRPWAFRSSLMRSAIPKDKSNSAFCSEMCIRDRPRTLATLMDGYARTPGVNLQDVYKRQVKANMES